MASPTSRTELKEYALRKLGAGAVRINVTDRQVEDRIDDAIKFWRDYHYAATERGYFKHALTDEDITNEYLTTPDDIQEIVKIVEAGSVFNSASSFTNPVYQFMLNEMWSLLGRPLSPYFIMRTELEHIREMLGTKIGFRFNRHSNKLFIDTNWKKFKAGQYLVFECFYYLDPETVTEQWGDRWLLQYSTALIKRQWAQNLSKFRGVRIMDGYEYNVDSMLQEANEEIRRLEDDVIRSYSIMPFGVIA